MVNTNGCSDLVEGFAVFGGTTLYLLIGALIAFIVYKIFKDADEEGRSLLVALSIIFWPIFIVMGIAYVVGMWFLMPILAATRKELKDTEDRLLDEINERCITSTVDTCNDKNLDIYGATFKVGDIITGIVPQTNYYGENISYKHLYQGCRCRVLSIDGNDSMKVILIGHKDKEAHKSVIGDSFTAPARNFTLVKKTVKKRKAVKARKSKR